ncbi:MAG: hypothetical protein JST44_16025 [Cyanobacteria bacterium SZAS LIN-5]|nr:hypothetical protein [Cyanobacteria bacterium SZAS LIN-5]
MLNTFNIFNLLFYSICYVLVFQHMAPGFSNGAVAFRPVSFFLKLLFGGLMYVGTTVIASIALLGDVVWSFSSFVVDIIDPHNATPFLVVVLAKPLMVQLSVWLTLLLAGLIMPGIIYVARAGAAWQAAYACSVLSLVFHLFVLFQHAPAGAYFGFMN